MIIFRKKNCCIPFGYKPEYSTRINGISFGTAPGFSALAKRDPFGATPGPSRGYFTLTFGDPARDTPGYSISNPSRFPPRPSYYVQNIFHKYKWNILYTDFMNINHTLTSLHARVWGCFDVKSLGSITLASIKKNVVIKMSFFYYSWPGLTYRYWTKILRFSRIRCSGLMIFVTLWFTNNVKNQKLAAWNFV